MWLVKPGLTNSAFSPVTGCTRTTGWIATSRLSFSRSGVRAVAPRPVRPAVAVLSAQRLDECLHRLGQALVGRDQVRPGGVAADLGHHLGAQNGASGRVHRGGHVGVPAGEVAVLAAPVLRAELLAVPLLVPPRVHGEDLRVVLRRRLVVRVRVGKLAELPAERDLRGVVQMLPAEEDDLVPVQRVADRGHLLRCEGARDVDVRDVRADVPGHRPHADRQYLLRFLSGRHESIPSRFPRGPEQR